MQFHSFLFKNPKLRQDYLEKNLLKLLAGGGECRAPLPVKKILIVIKYAVYAQFPFWSKSTTFFLCEVFFQMSFQHPPPTTPGGARAHAPLPLPSYATGENYAQRVKTTP